MTTTLHLSLAASLLLAAGAVAAEGDAELVKFTAAIEHYDLDGDGYIGDDEAMDFDDRYPLIVVNRLLGTIRHPSYDLDGDRRIGATDLKLLLAQEWTPAGIKQMMGDYDHDQDGRLNREESLIYRHVLAYSYKASDPESLLRRFFWIQGGGVDVPDTICQVADRDGNGMIDMVERPLQKVLALQRFDENEDHQPGPTEWMTASEETYFQDALFRLCPEVNQDNDSWLSAAEMAQALAKVTPIYDIDKNGSLDWVERFLVIRDGQAAWPRRTLVKALSTDLGIVESSIQAESLDELKDKILALAAAKYGGPGATRFGLPEIFVWRRQVENAQILAMQDTVVGWLETRLQVQMHPAWDAAAKTALARKRFAVYDVNHDGKFDGLECCRLMQGEFLPGNAYFYFYVLSNPNDAVAWMETAYVLAGSRFEGMGLGDQQTVLPLMFGKVDLNGDGFFSPAEALALKPRVEEKRQERRMNAAIEDLLWTRHPHFTITAAERKAENDKCLQRFDLDHDGKFSPEERQSLLTALEVETRDRVLAIWLETLGRFADANGDGQLDAQEKILANALLRFCYDRNATGVFEKDEIASMRADIDHQASCDYQRRQRQEQDRKLLPAYDLDGNGRLSAAERARAAADQARKEKAKVIAPPQED